MIIIIIFLFTSGLYFYMLFRNKVVFKESSRLSEEVCKHRCECIDKDIKPIYNYTDIEDYNKMIWQLFTFHWELKKNKEIK